jgi:hypothetical protein
LYFSQLITTHKENKRKEYRSGGDKEFAIETNPIICPSSELIIAAADRIVFPCRVARERDKKQFLALLYRANQ